MRRRLQPIVPTILFSLTLIGAHDPIWAQNAVKQKEQRADAVKRIYEAFVFEKLICSSVVAAIRHDPQLIHDLTSQRTREERGVHRLIESSSVAADDAIKYFLRHRDYLEVDVDYHGGPNFVFVQDTGIYCGQTRKRLEELETYGPSEYAWEVRAHFLRGYLSDMHIPSLEPAADYGTSMDFVSRFFVEAKKLYKDDVYRERLRQWAAEIVAPVKTEIEHAKGLTPEELAEILHCSACFGAPQKPTAKDVENAKTAIEEHIELLNRWTREVEANLGNHNP